MIYVIETSTGKIVQRVDAPDGHAKHYERKGCSVLTSADAIDIAASYVVDSGFVPIPEQPSEYHVWDWPSLNWKQDRALAEKAVRNKRAMLLSNTVDKINAVRWAAMSESERATWDAYRTSLLDITEQDGFPFDVIWPLAPQQ